MKKRQYFPVEVKRTAVKRVAAGEAVSTVALDIGTKSGRLYAWYRKYQEGGLDGLRRHGRPGKAEALRARARSLKEAPDESAAARRRIAELERKIGQQQVDLDFFRKALRHVEETRRGQAKAGAAASTRSSKSERQAHHQRLGLEQQLLFDGRADLVGRARREHLHRR